MAGPLRRVADYFYVDDDETRYFSVSDFLRHNPNVRDTPESRAFISAEIKIQFPGTLILEEQDLERTLDRKTTGGTLDVDKVNAGFIEPFATNKAGSMESTEERPVIAVKASATAKAFALIDADYIQAHHNVGCRFCSTRYLLFVYFKERDAKRQNEREIRPETIRYFFDEIAKDHATGHLQDQFIEPRSASLE